MGEGRGGVGEDRCGCRAHAGAPHDIFGVRLRRLEAGAGHRRSTCRDPGFGQRVRHACGQRRLRPDDDEVDVVRQGEPGHRGGVGDVEAGHHGGDPRHARVAGGDEEPAQQRALGELPRDGVLPPSASEEQHLHGPVTPW